VKRAVNRKDFLEHVAWTGSGITWSLTASGLLASRPAGAATPAFSFVQISDSHVGFSQPANPDVLATLTTTVDAINALPVQPAFVVHTGDVTHLAKAAQFDSAKQALGMLKAPLIVLPGEHDVIGSSNAFFGAFGRRDAPNGWFSFDQGGIHFLSLVNVFNFEVDGELGTDQLAFVENDLKAQKTSTPIVVFGHVPLYALYPPWGWTTEDGARVLAALRRFDAVTVLNGHIHQIIQHTEGNIRFATAAATGYPQPAPGTAAQPGPLTVPEDMLLRVLGYRSVDVAPDAPARIADHPLG
jgi:3',5'-cyclic AMP phosphodiesterase CpdA